MNIASPSLVRYLQRVDLPAGDSCQCFLSGVAAYLAAESWLSDAEERGERFKPRQELLDIAPAPSREALDFSHYFAGALVTKDPEYGSVFSLAVVLAGAWRRMWPEEDRDDWLHGDWAAELGWYVAAEATGSGAAWSDDNPEHGLHPPSIHTGEEFFAKPEPV